MSKDRSRTGATPSATRRRLVALGTLAVVATACEDVSHGPGAEGDSEEEGHDGAAADPLDHPGEADPQPTVPPLPYFEVAPPLRASDLKVGDIPRLSSNPGWRWHDLTVARWDGGWQGSEPGGTTEQDEIDWGIPVYAGVDGEVIDCWRDSPYVMAFAEVSDKLRIGGNFVTIRTADDHYVYYAHMDDGSIPNGVCPNTSADGFLVDLQDTVDCLIASKCATTETYLHPGERPQIKAGQYLGRIGAHGQAAGAHLHMQAGDVVEDEGGILNILDTPYHVVFDRTFFQPKATPPDKGGWMVVDDAQSQGDMLAAADAGVTMFWPSAKTQQASVSSYRLGDVDGDGRDDTICHSTSSGTVWRDRASDFGELGGTDWSRAGGWCNADSQRLHTGDFGGDGRTDLLCHDEDSGNIWVDTANASGEFYGTNFSTGADWCSDDTQRLYTGDFDGDGDDDLLCHDAVDGRRWVDLAGVGFPITSNRFHGTDHYASNAWCGAHYHRLHLGDFNGDGRTDLLCHDTRSGTLYFDYASASGSFRYTNRVRGPWCNGGGQHLMVGNVMSGPTDELVCFDGDDGKTYVDQAPFGTTDWSGVGANWCDEPHQRTRLGDIDGDGRDDLLCFDESDGRRWVDYAQHPGSLGGIFSGTDWSSGGTGWCGHPDQGLH